MGGLTSLNPGATRCTATARARSRQRVPGICVRALSGLKTLRDHGRRGFSDGISMIAKDLVLQEVLHPSRSWTGGMLGRRRRVMGDSRDCCDRPTAHTPARHAERVGHQPPAAPGRIGTASLARTVDRRPRVHATARPGAEARRGGVGRGSVAPDGGISGSEKILEKASKIEI